MSDEDEADEADEKAAEGEENASPAKRKDASASSGLMCGIGLRVED
jgi:hypothetical protein